MVRVVLESLATMSAPKILETQAHFEMLLAKLMDEAAVKHADLSNVPGSRWQPGDRCEDALLGDTKMQGAEVALGIIAQCELQLDARFVEAQRINEQDDPACD